MTVVPLARSCHWLQDDAHQSRENGSAVVAHEQSTIASRPTNHQPDTMTVHPQRRCGIPGGACARRLGRDHSPLRMNTAVRTPTAMTQQHPAKQRGGRKQTLAAREKSAQVAWHVALTRYLTSSTAINTMSVRSIRQCLGVIPCAAHGPNRRAISSSRGIAAFSITLSYKPSRHQGRTAVEIEMTHRVRQKSILLSVLVTATTYLTSKHMVETLASRPSR